MDIVAYGERYNRAMQGVEDMLLDADNPLKSFKKDRYVDSFQSYLGKYIDVLDAIEEIYLQEEDSAAWLEKLADHLVESAERELAAIPKKGKRSEQQVNYNMILAIYVFPAILEKKGTSSEPLTDLMVEKWNRAFKTSVGKATFEKIESGFHKKLCYITTAACESQGRADDCYELTLLRDYRDSYLMSSAEGAELVEEYYNIAPTIVNRISRQKNAKELYGEIWDSYLIPCVHLIEEGEQEACRERYMDMVHTLKGRYMA